MAVRITCNYEDHWEVYNLCSRDQPPSIALTSPVNLLDILCSGLCVCVNVCLSSVQPMKATSNEWFDADNLNYNPLLEPDKCVIVGNVQNTFFVQRSHTTGAT